MLFLGPESSFGVYSRWIGPFFLFGENGPLYNGTLLWFDWSTDMRHAYMNSERRLRLMRRTGYF